MRRARAHTYTTAGAYRTQHHTRTHARQDDGGTRHANQTTTTTTVRGHGTRTTDQTPSVYPLRRRRCLACVHTRSTLWRRGGGGGGGRRCQPVGLSVAYVVVVENSTTATRAEPLVLAAAGCCIADAR